MKRDIIGLVGLPGSGKNEAANYLKTKGFAYVSLSDTLRTILSYLKIHDSRLQMEDVGDILRDNLGSEVLARGIKLQIDKGQNHKIVIDGIRNPGELNFLKKELGAFIVGITMSSRKMFMVLKKRNRKGDPKTIEEFKKMVSREQGYGEKETGLQIKKCMEHTDIIIENETTIDALHRNLDRLLS